LKWQVLILWQNLTGAIKQRPREDRALQTVNAVGEAFKLYVEKNSLLKPKKRQREDDSKYYFGLLKARN
jgi:hypothetical protein